MDIRKYFVNKNNNITSEIETISSPYNEKAEIKKESKYKTKNAMKNSLKDSKSFEDQNNSTKNTKISIKPLNHIINSNENSANSDDLINKLNNNFLLLREFEQRWLILISVVSKSLILINEQTKHVYLLCNESIYTSQDINLLYKQVYLMHKNNNNLLVTKEIKDDIVIIRYEALNTKLYLKFVYSDHETNCFNSINGKNINILLSEEEYIKKENLNIQEDKKREQKENIVKVDERVFEKCMEDKNDKEIMEDKNEEMFYNLKEIEIDKHNDANQECKNFFQFLNKKRNKKTIEEEIKGKIEIINEEKNPNNNSNSSAGKKNNINIEMISQFSLENKVNNLILMNNLTKKEIIPKKEISSKLFICLDTRFSIFKRKANKDQINENTDENETNKSFSDTTRSKMENELFYKQKSRLSIDIVNIIIDVDNEFFIVLTNEDIMKFYFKNNFSTNINNNINNVSSVMLFNIIQDSKDNNDSNQVVIAFKQFDLKNISLISLSKHDIRENNKILKKDCNNLGNEEKNKFIIDCNYNSNDNDEENISFSPYMSYLNPNKLFITQKGFIDLEINKKEVLQRVIKNKLWDKHQQEDKMIIEDDDFSYPSKLNTMINLTHEYYYNYNYIRKKSSNEIDLIAFIWNSNDNKCKKHCVCNYQKEFLYNIVITQQTKTTLLEQEINLFNTSYKEDKENIIIGEKIYSYRRKFELKYHFYKVNSVIIINTQVNKLIENNTNEAESLSFNNDSLKIVSCSADSTICIWNFQTGTLLNTLRNNMDRVTKILPIISNSDTNCMFISSSNDGYLRVWCVNSGKCLKKNKRALSPISNFISLHDNYFCTFTHDESFVKFWKITNYYCSHCCCIPKS